MKVHQQTGMTLIGFIFVLIWGLFIAFLGMKIGPLYLEYYTAVRIMKGLAAEKGSARLSPYEIRVRVLTGLDLNYSDNIKEAHIKISKRNGVILRIAYEVRAPVIGNLDVVTKFDKSVRLSN